MAEAKKPAPTNPDQHAPGISKTLEDHATKFREARPEERTEPKIKPVTPEKE